MKPNRPNEPFRQPASRIRFDQNPSKRPITLVKMPWDDKPEDSTDDVASLRKA